MRVEDADVIPHRKKKDSSKSKASARSDHEHYYAIAVTKFYDVCERKVVSTSRRIVCIFCGESHKRMNWKQRAALEEYTNNTVWVNWSKKC